MLLMRVQTPPAGTTSGDLSTGRSNRAHRRPDDRHFEGRTGTEKGPSLVQQLLTRLRPPLQRSPDDKNLRSSLRFSKCLCDLLEPIRAFYLRALDGPPIRIEHNRPLLTSSGEARPERAERAFSCGKIVPALPVHHQRHIQDQTAFHSVERGGKDRPNARR